MRNTISYKILCLSFLLFTLYGCYTSYSITDQTNEYDASKANIKKVLILPPEFISVKKTENKKSNILNEQKGQDILISTLKKGLKDIKLEYTLLDNINNTNTQELFEYIVPLKKELITSSGLHDDPFESSHPKTFTKKLFARAPKLDPKYNILTEKYGTPYVIFVGIYSNENLHYQYFIMADLNRSEIIYRNLKFIGQKAKKDNIEPILYDTFYSLKHK